MDIAFNRWQMFLMQGMSARNKGMRLYKESRKKRTSGFNHLPVMMRIMAKLKTPDLHIFTDGMPLTKEVPCRQCKHPMVIARVQFARVHRKCRSLFRQIHGSFRHQKVA